MTPIKRRLLYIFRDTLLRLRITWDHGKTLTLSVGYHVDRTDAKGRPKWDGSRCVRNTTHGDTKVSASTINRVLEQLEERVDKIFYHYEQHDIIPSPAQLKADLSPEKGEKPPTLGNLIRQYVSEQSVLRQWSKNSVVSAQSALAALKNTFGEDYDIRKIDNDAVVKLMDHLTSKDCFDFKRTTKEVTTHRGLSNRTINIYMILIGAFIRWAEEKGYVSDCPLEKSRIKTLKTAKIPVIYLTMEELDRLMAVEVTPYEHRIRECFLFCCFTGIRFSDMRNLLWSHVKQDSIEIVTQKTTDRVKIELNKYSRAILEGRQRGRDDEHVFLPPVNFYYNAVVKRIAERAKIDDIIEMVTYSGKERKVTLLPKWHYITSHTPRKTFVTNALSLGIPPAIVMKWTGHKSLSAMAPYMDIISKAKETSMDQFNTLSFSPD